MSRKIEDFVLKELKKLYPAPRSQLNFLSPFQLSVAVLLSAQCTDKKVNEISPLLFKKWPNFKALSKARISVIEKLIRPINYYRSKARNLSGLAKRVHQEFASVLPQDFDELISLPGIGRKCANVILTELGVAETLPVDTHVFRVSRRLGLASANTRDKVEFELRARFKSKDWRNLHHWLIYHGRRVCKAQRPLCAECGLKRRCPSRQL